MQVEVFVVNAFTSAGQGGNPAGVVLSAEQYSDADMQLIATEMALPETAFVLPSTDCDLAVRFFAPTAEVDFCGHATVATFSLLKQKGLLGKPAVVQQTKAGNLAVKIADTGEVEMTQLLPTFDTVLPASEVAGLLGIAESDIGQTALPVQILSTGLRDIFVPVVNEDVLNAIKPDNSSLASFNRMTNTVGVHAFTLNTCDELITASCRNFAPLYGIKEESATGSASGALACYLSRYADRFDGVYLFEQGKAMGQASRLVARVTKEKDAISQVVVSGYGTLVKSVHVSI
ncbi:PhzF family phenazine biosynthesis protein [Chitinimonas sp. PSY-7]|uniref:PhzF family phenazine biosynthesis isomerase n=1 Tax=Chitinimonas sp. PSY-7 TaxID=3459088 RepID=UPI00403FF98D